MLLDFTNGYRILFLSINTQNLLLSSKRLLIVIIWYPIKHIITNIYLEFHLKIDKNIFMLRNFFQVQELFTEDNKCCNHEKRN